MGWREILEHEQLVRQRIKLLIRKGVPLFLLAVLIPAVMMWIQDRAKETDYLQAMKAISQQFLAFKKEYDRLPRQTEFAEFEIRTRYLRMHAIQYEPDWLTDKAPGDLIAAYSHAARLQFSTDRHAVLLLNGSVSWLTSDELDKALTVRRQRYNADLIQ